MRLALAAVAILVALNPVTGAQRSYGPGVCGPLDLTHVRNATATGGQPFPMSPSEIAKMGIIIAESSRSDAAMILWASGTSGDAEGGFTVPIDSSIQRATFSVTFDGQGGSVEIAAPDGSVIPPKGKSEDLLLNCGRILSVDTPATGEWRVTPRPTGRFWVVVQGRSDRDLISADFVKAAGRPGHDGLFQINGMPIAGRPAILRVRLSEPAIRIPDFVLLSSQGRPIQRVQLDRVEASEYVGEIDLPTLLFRVAITGTDERGVSYQRLDAKLMRGESVEVLPSSVDTIKAGEDTALVFIVKNHGARARYRITATAGGKVLKRVEPDLVEIDRNGEQRVNVWLPAAKIAAVGHSIELFVVAAGEGPAESSVNSAFQRVNVVKD